MRYKILWLYAGFENNGVLKGGGVRGRGAEGSLGNLGEP